jgi:hypothetical protein
MALCLLERHKITRATLLFHEQAYVSIIIASNQILHLNVLRFFVGKQVILIHDEQITSEESTSRIRTATEPNQNSK